MATILLVGLIIMLSARLRAREMETLFKIGCAGHDGPLVYRRVDAHRPCELADRWDPLISDGDLCPTSLTHASFKSDFKVAAALVASEFLPKTLRKPLQSMAIRGGVAIS